jgi:hypothetical protein
MIPYDIDPSLYTGDPEPPMLDDGFSPPHHAEPAAIAQAPPAPVDVQIDPALEAKSPH